MLGVIVFVRTCMSVKALLLTLAVVVYLALFLHVYAPRSYCLISLLYNETKWVMLQMQYIWCQLSSQFLSTHPNSFAAIFCHPHIRLAWPKVSNFLPFVWHSKVQSFRSPSFIEEPVQRHRPTVRHETLLSVCLRNFCSYSRWAGCWCDDMALNMCVCMCYCAGQVCWRTLRSCQAFGWSSFTLCASYLPDRYVCVDKFRGGNWCMRDHLSLSLAHVQSVNLKQTWHLLLTFALSVFLSGWAGLPCGLPVGPLLQDRERGDGDHGERQQAPPSERAAASRRLLLHGQNDSEPGKDNKWQRCPVSFHFLIKCFCIISTIKN